MLQNPFVLGLLSFLVWNCAHSWPNYEPPTYRSYDRTDDDPFEEPLYVRQSFARGRSQIPPQFAALEPHPINPRPGDRRVPTGLSPLYPPSANGRERIQNLGAVDRPGGSTLDTRPFVYVPARLRLKYHGMQWLPMYIDRVNRNQAERFLRVRSKRSSQKGEATRQSKLPWMPGFCDLSRFANEKKDVGSGKEELLKSTAEQGKSLAASGNKNRSSNNNYHIPPPIKITVFGKEVDLNRGIRTPGGGRTIVIGGGASTYDQPRAPPSPPYFAQNPSRTEADVNYAPVAAPLPSTNDEPIKIKVFGKYVDLAHGGIRTPGGGRTYVIGGMP